MTMSFKGRDDKRSDELELEYPIYMNPAQFQDFMEGYATDFDLKKDIVFNSNVKRVTRNDGNTKWLLEVESSGRVEALEFDKVALCHGYQTTAKIPTFGGEEKFEGNIVHSQQYRSKIEEAKFAGGRGLTIEKP